MFVGEAPGRFGAGRTGVPFSGDTAGARFEHLLAEAGLDRQAVFITNAVLCLPLDSAGRNRTPRIAEIRNCSCWLEDTIRAVNPALVVAMGAVAMRAVQAFEPTPLTLSNVGQPPLHWHDRLLAVVYHPGARSQVHRPWARQLEDWRELGKHVRKLA